MSGGSAFDKIKQAASQNSEKVSQSVDRLKNMAKAKTGGKYDEKIDKAGDSATDYLTGQGGENQDQGGQRGQSGQDGESGRSGRSEGPPQQ